MTVLQASATFMPAPPAIVIRKKRTAVCAIVDFFDEIGKPVFDIRRHGAFVNIIRVKVDVLIRV